MTINKFQGKTEEEAIERAKEEFGEDAVIMNVRQVKPKGFFSMFKTPTYEVTAAMKEKESYVTPNRAVQNPQKLHDSVSVDLAADEKIDLNQMDEPSSFEKRLDALSDKLEKSLAEHNEVRRKMQMELPEEELVPEEKPAVPHTKTAEELNFARILYSTLIKNDVNEKYVNQVIEEVEKFIRPGKSVDTILANVYQKLILRFGQPKTIDLNGKKPRVVFFIGPTGVGKTTSIAKIASRYKVEYNKNIAFLTADTYRIAATEQLQVYANILQAPMGIVYSAEDLNKQMEKFAEHDLVFVDTAGFSHKNEEQKQDVKGLIQGLDEAYEKEVYLVLSATTKYRDLCDIVDSYHKISDYKLIFTKLDETTTYGNLLNVKLYSGADLSYVTNGQNVPDDIEVFDTQKIVKQLLGGNV